MIIDIIRQFLQLTDQRKKRVTDLYFSQHKTYAEIAQIERIAPRDIHTIRNEEKARRQKYENDKRQQQEQELSAKAYDLFSKGKTPTEVAIVLKIRARSNQIVQRILEIKASAYTQFHIQWDKW